MNRVQLIIEKINNPQEFFEAFRKKTLEEEGFLSDDYIEVPFVEPFPVYFGDYYKDSEEENLVTIMKVMRDHFIDLRQDIYLNERFWRSYMTTERDFRMYLINKYKGIDQDFEMFRVIVLRNFDWENYLYKAGVLSSSICDHVLDKETQDKYFNVVNKNRDLFNYILKSATLRNDRLIVNIIKLLIKYEDEGLSKILKSKIKSDDKKDERYIRLVLREISVAYPTILIQVLDEESFEQIFLEYLGQYYELGPEFDKKKSKKEIEIASSEPKPVNKEDQVAENNNYNYIIETLQDIAGRAKDKADDNVANNSKTKFPTESFKSIEKAREQSGYRRLYKIDFIYNNSESRFYIINNTKLSDGIRKFKDQPENELSINSRLGEKMYESIKNASYHVYDDRKNYKFTKVEDLVNGEIIVLENDGDLLSKKSEDQDSFTVAEEENELKVEKNSEDQERISKKLKNHSPRHLRQRSLVHVMVEKRSTLQM